MDSTFCISEGFLSEILENTIPDEYSFIMCSSFEVIVIPCFVRMYGDKINEI